jgi:hypothetical protein
VDLITLTVGFETVAQPLHVLERDDVIAAKTGQGSAAITVSSGLGCSLFTSHSRLDAAPYHKTAAAIGTSAAKTSGCRPV